MESLEWWGENSFFSRQTSCAELTNSCVQCLSFSDLKCGWCSGGSNKCAKQDAGAGCALLTGCVIQATTTTTTNEDVAVTLSLSTIYFISSQVNGTQGSFNGNGWITTWVASSTQCVVSYDNSTDTLTLTPGADWSGTCLIQITTKGPLVIGYSTILKANWTVVVVPVNDPVQLIESSASTVLSGLANAKQGQRVLIEGCQLFSDVDKEDFSVTISGTIVSGGAITPITTPCNCYTGNKKCQIGYTANSEATGDITIRASDATTNAETSVGVSVSTVNQAPVVLTSGVRTLSANEGDETAVFDFGSDFDDPDDYPNQRLEYTITSLSPLALEATFDGSVLTIKPDPTKNGTVSANVTASDGDKTAVKAVSFVLNPTNDPVIIAESIKGKEFSKPAGQNTTYDLSSEVTDEDNVFSDDSLSCTAGTVEGGVAIVTITRGILLIQHRLETTGTRVSITCRDNRTPQSVAEPFEINIIVTFTNSPPTSTALPLVTSPPPAAGQITLSPITLSTYFKDVDTAVGQVLTYTATASNNSAVDFVQSSLDTGVLSLVMKAGAIGFYNVTVTGTDNLTASTTQVQSVLAYVAPVCSGITSNWNPINSLVVNVASFCVASNSYTVTFTETETAGTLFATVSFSISGSQITFTSSDSCASGKYLGVAKVTDSAGASAEISVELTLKPSSSSVSSIKSSFSYLVVNSSSTNSTGYDGTTTVSGNKVKINLVQLVKLCGSTGGLKFDQEGTETYTFLSGVANNDGLDADINGVNLFIEGTTRVATILRSWNFQVMIKVQDNQTGSVAYFTLMVYKPYSG